jgi:hypothetical protein
MEYVFAQMANLIMLECAEMMNVEMAIAQVLKII